MPIKKSELYSSLWKSCDELRGSMDASQYKDYVLVLLFVKYVSDRYAGQIKAAILADADFGTYRQTVDAAFERWRAGNLPWLKGIVEGSRPKQLIERLAEDLLRAFADVPLIDKYDVYQHLMAYWTETMQDDVYLLAADGWRASEELIPPRLVVARYFAAEQEAVDALEAAHEAIGQQMASLDEEQGGEGGLLEEAKNDKGKISKAAVKARLKAIAGDAEAADERAALGEYLGLLDQEAETARQIREAQKALAAQVAARYKALSEDEVKALVVDDKWLAALAADVQTELDRVSQGLSGRVKELAERYDVPLPQLDADVDALSAKVQAHLARMGFPWS